MDLLKKHYQIVNQDPQQAFDSSNTSMLKDFMFICHKKCVDFRVTDLQKNEKDCLKNCAGKFYKSFLQIQIFSDTR
jgi:hypothetical protein